MLSVNHGECFSDAQLPSRRTALLLPRFWSDLECDERKAMRREILGLLCPEWRRASLLLNAGDCSIAYANGLSQQLLGSGDVIRRLGGRLDLCSRAQNLRLRSCLTDLEEGKIGCSYLAGRNPETEKPFLLTMYRAEGFLHEALAAYLLETSDDANLIAVEINVVEDQPEPAALTALAGEFGLSRAETQLVQLFAGGMTLEEAADQRGVALNTARQQMKAILSKTNCSRQQDLMRLVFSLYPGRGPSPLLSTTSSKVWQDRSPAVAPPGMTQHAQCGRRPDASSPNG